MGMMKRVVEAKLISLYYKDADGNHYFRTFTKDRKGTYTESVSKRSLGELNYVETSKHNDLTYDDMLDIINNICELQHIDRIIIS